MSNKSILPILSLVLLLFSSCKVDFSPNAEWREVPSVFCVLDPEEDTVWARVQRCYLGEDNLFNYSGIADSNYYLEDDISVYLLAWQGELGRNNIITQTSNLVDKWKLSYTKRAGKPEGSFPSGLQPLYYCVPGSKLREDSLCVFQLVVIRNSTGDTIAKASTMLVGFGEIVHDSIEDILMSPNGARGQEFGYRLGCRGELKWKTVPRGRLYQPAITFYYKKHGDTLGIDIKGATVKNTSNALFLSSKSITQERFLSTIYENLKDNTDTLYSVNNVDVVVYVCNEDLNAYISSQNTHVTSGQEFHTYTNIDGGYGIFGSRRTHIRVNVPCDSVGKPGYLPQNLVDLGVGFYGHFRK